MAKEKAPHMPWYGREFYGDENVIVMTLEQEGAYQRLNWNCWQEGSIPADMAKLAAICKNTPLRKFERDIWPALEGCYSATADGRLVHPKVELLRSAKEQRRTVWSEAGKRGNEKRWGGDRVGDTNPITRRCKRDSNNDRVSISADCRMPITDKTLCSSADEQSPEIALELTAGASEKTLDEWFDLEFWPAYPRRVAKPKALAAARRHGKTAADRAVILACLRRRLPSLQAQNRADGNFIPYPASWLNQMPWTEPEETAKPTEMKAFNPDVLYDLPEELRLKRDGE